MYTIGHRFGDARSKQTKRQKQRTSNPGSGRRRNDPQIHATSRPWHTSTPGVRMNVSTLGQIAGTHPVRNKYLNRMKLSEMAQKKRGIAESEEGRGIDKMGRAIKRGTQGAVRDRIAYGAPNQDTIDRMHQEILGKQVALEREAPRTLSAQEGRDITAYGQARTALGATRAPTGGQRVIAGMPRPGAGAARQAQHDAATGVVAAYQQAQMGVTATERLGRIGESRQQAITLHQQQTAAIGYQMKRDPKQRGRYQHHKHSY